VDFFARKFFAASHDGILPRQTGLGRKKFARICRYDTSPRPSPRSRRRGRIIASWQANPCPSAYSGVADVKGLNPHVASPPRGFTPCPPARDLSESVVKKTDAPAVRPYQNNWR
jgi:hypothetical protein